MDAQTLRAALADLPADAQVNVRVGSHDWIIDHVSFDPVPEIVPGTSGRVRQPTFRLHIA